MIRLKDVEMEYENGTAAIRGISLDIQDGEFVFLVGPSGSGKSTLIKLLTGEVVPSSGRIMVNGFAVSSITPRILPLMRRTLGIIFQDFRLIPKKTVYDNLDFVMRAVGAPNKEIRQRIPYVLDLVGLKKKADYYPTELSGGEAQRLKLASEMGRAQHDTVFVFDEPTIGLHPLDVRTLLGVSRTLIENGATVIVIEHDLDVIRSADYLIDMGPGGGEEGGRVVACGTPAEVKRNPESRTGKFI